MESRGSNCLKRKADEIIVVVKILHKHCKTKRPYRALLDTNSVNLMIDTKYPNLS